MQPPLLVVLAGRPGIGKTTLAVRITAMLQAAVVRGDAIATAVLRSGLTQDPATAGRVAYEVAHEIVAGTLQAGTPVVVDAVNATHERRAAWVSLADRLDARLVVLEIALADPVEHRRRVEERRPDLVGQVLSGWAQIQGQRYDVWDNSRDGPRHVIEMTDLETALDAAMALVRTPGG